MVNQISLVTAPDDIVQDGNRVLFINLNPEQTQLVSKCLQALENIPKLIVYVWHTEDNVDWLLDKNHKSKLILFNADNNSNDIITGYIAAQPNAYYFGTLGVLQHVNTNNILNLEQLTQLFSTHLI